jgi:hypothetical protein
MFHVLRKAMTQKLANPFLIAGYNRPDYFCERERETGKIMDALSNFLWPTKA